MKFRKTRIASFLATLIALVACSEPSSPALPPRHVVLIVVDTLRADRLGCYGYERNTSPSIDALANKGVRFERAFATAPYTPASTASILTGLYPFSHGYLNQHYRVTSSVLTLPEIFKAAGFHTAAVVANVFVGSDFGLEAGYDDFIELYRATERPPGSNHPLLADEVLRQTTRLLDDISDERLFLYLHLMDPHEPVYLPLSWQTFYRDELPTSLAQPGLKMFMDHVSQAHHPRFKKIVESYVETYSELYDAAIRYADTHIASLFAELEARGMSESTLIILTADHGEQLLDHGYVGHGNTSYDEVLHVPLIVFDPTRTEWKAMTVRSDVSLVDLTPTILDRLGIEVPGNLDGSSLVPTLEAVAQGNQEPSARAVYSEGDGNTGFFGSRLTQTIRRDGFKLMWNREQRRKELFDTRRDPHEKSDVLAERQDIAEDLLAELASIYQRNLEQFSPESSFRDEALAEKIREIGYATSEASKLRYRPMTHATLDPFGPFGDESSLSRYSSRLDFTTLSDPARGYSLEQIEIDPPRLSQARDALWIDLEASFLLANRSSGERIRVEVEVAQKGARTLLVAVNDRLIETKRLTLGKIVLEAQVDETISQAPWWRVRLSADQHTPAHELGLTNAPNPGDELAIRTCPRVSCRVVSVEILD